MDPYYADLEQQIMAAREHHLQAARTHHVPDRSGAHGAFPPPQSSPLRGEGREGGLFQATAPPSDVAGALTRLRQTCEDTQHLAHRLEERLGTVLRDLVRVPREAEEPHPASCQLSHELRGLDAGVADTNAVLQALLERCAL